MGEPLVSVIIPCYNAEKYIDVCVQSVLDQTIGLEQIEIILINDASCDGTLEKLYRHEREYSDQILVINCEVNRKQGYARNLGMQYSRGQYITFLDADDYLATDMIEKLYRKAREGYDYVICNYYRVLNGKPIIMEGVTLEKEVCFSIDSDAERKKLLRTDIPVAGSWGILYNRDFLLEHNIQYPPDTYYEDLLWLGMLGYYAKKVCIIPDRLYYYVNWDNTSVLMKLNSPHHFMRLHVMELFLDEVKKRGLYDRYKDEAEMHFLQLYYISSITFFAVRYETAPLDVMIQMRETVLEKVPDYAGNPYIKDCYPFQQTILKLIELNPRGQAQWDEIFRTIREGYAEG